MEFFGEYDVVVVGAGVTGVVASIVASKQGAKVLLVEASGTLGGLLSGGRLTRPNGVVQAGVHRDMLVRAREYGGADDRIRRWPHGSYSGLFDPEVMQRVIIELIEEHEVDALLYCQVTDTVKDRGAVRGVVFQTKSGKGMVSGRCFIDASGDGDLAAISGADFMLGRVNETLQPMTNYFRILNVDVPALVRFCTEHRDDLTNLYPEDGGSGSRESYTLKFFANGFSNRIRYARNRGFNWIVPRDSMVLKAGLLPGEINLNASRFHGNALDTRDRSRAAIELRKQSYCIHDFLKLYVDGFRESVLYDVAPTLGVRETRRIIGEYVLTGRDVQSEARFVDAIGLTNCPMDIHQPSGERLIVSDVGNGYGIPFRTLIPRNLDGILVAGRCISADEIAFSSARNTPACALTAEAAGVAAAMAARLGVSPGNVPVSDVQGTLRSTGIVLGTHATDRIPGA